MKIKIDAELIKGIINMVKEISEDGIISIRKKEIYICLLSDGRTDLIEFSINESDFEIIQKTVTAFKIGVNFQTLWKVVKEFKKGNMAINFTAKTILFSQNAIKVTYNLFDENTLSNMEITNSKPLKDIEYPLLMNVSFDNFKKITALAEIFSETIIIKMSSKKGIYFMSEGLEGKIIHFKQTDLYNSLSKKDLKEEEIYGIKIISQIIKLSKIADNFDIRIKKGAPAYFTINLGNESVCNFIAAPRIEEEEEEYNEEDGEE